MLCNDGQIKLIELNNRISGGMGVFNKLASYSGLLPQDELFISVLKSGNSFSYSPLQLLDGYSRAIFIFKFDYTPMKDPRPILSQFSSVKEVLLLKDIGYIPDIIDNLNLLDCACIITLHNKDQYVLDTETQKIFTLEQDGELV